MLRLAAPLAPRVLVVAGDLSMEQAQSLACPSLPISHGTHGEWIDGPVLITFLSAVWRPAALEQVFVLAREVEDGLIDDDDGRPLAWIRSGGCAIPSILPIGSPLQLDSPAGIRPVDESSNARALDLLTTSPMHVSPMHVAALEHSPTSGATPAARLSQLQIRVSQRLARTSLRATQLEAVIFVSAPLAGLLFLTDGWGPICGALTLLLGQLMAPVVANLHVLRSLAAGADATRETTRPCTATGTAWTAAARPFGQMVAILALTIFMIGEPNAGQLRHLSIMDVAVLLVAAVAAWVLFICGRATIRGGGLGANWRHIDLHRIFARLGWQRSSEWILPTYFETILVVAALARSEKAMWSLLILAVGARFSQWLIAPISEGRAQTQAQS